MTRNDADDPASSNFECVEPALGKQMWRRDVAGTDPALTRQLRLHLGICDACRLMAAVEDRVGRGLADGTLQLRDGDSPPRREHGRLPWLPTAAVRGRFRTAGTVAIAAGLALAFLLPPLPRDSGRIERSTTGEPRFSRPIEGEVLLDRTPELRWLAISGATAYDLVVRGEGGEYRWQTRTDATRAQVPAENALPVGTDLLVTLIPVPTDLASLQGINASFRVDGLLPFLRYRLANASTVASSFAIAGLLALLLVVVSDLALRRRSRQQDAT